MGADESKPTETRRQASYNYNRPPGSSPSTSAYRQPAEPATTVGAGGNIAFRPIPPYASRTNPASTPSNVDVKSARTLPTPPAVGADGNIAFRPIPPYGAYNASRTNPASTPSNVDVNSARTPPTNPPRSGVPYIVPTNPFGVQTSVSGANQNSPNAARISTPPVSTDNNLYPSLHKVETESRFDEVVTVDTSNLLLPNVQSSRAGNAQADAQQMRSVEENIKNFDVPEIDTMIFHNAQASQPSSAPSTSSTAKVKQAHAKNIHNKGICKQKGTTKNAQGHKGFVNNELTRSTIFEIENGFNLVTLQDTNKGKVNRAERTLNYRNQAQHNVLSQDTISCPICMEPMLGAIYQCVSGHSLCDRCRENLTEAVCPSCRMEMTHPIRNRALEELIEKMKIPCSNREKGCIFSLPTGNMRDHLEECIYRTMTCPVGTVLGRCFWKGDMKDMKDHFQNFHPNESGLEPGTEITVKNVSADNRTVNLIAVGKFIFLLHVKVDTQQKRTYWLIQNVGTKNAAKNWAYELHFYNKSEPKRKLFYADCCSSDTESADALFRNARCAVVPSDVLATFFNAGKFNYKFYVRKTDRKPDLGKPERNRNQDDASSDADPRENRRKGRNNKKNQ